MNKKRIKVFAPATIANLGPGFDVLGLAINEPGDIAIASLAEEPGLHFQLTTTIANIPNDHTNVAAHVAQLLLDAFKPPFGISLELIKQLPLGSGLGSSGASCAAAAVAVNALLPHPLAKQDLIPFAMEGERLASGSPHADNVAPAILGGLCLIRCYDPLDVIQLPCSASLYWVVAHPSIIVHTKTARELLPDLIPIATATLQAANLAALITGLNFNDHSLITAGLVDHIAEPCRAKLIPAFTELKHSALSAGALAFSISGSGPSVFAIATSLANAKKIAKALSKVMKGGDIYISTINPDGTKIIEANE